MKEDEVYLRHIRDAIDQIGEYTSDVDREEFQESSMVQDAVVRQIEIIGEAAKQLSSETIEEYSSVPWADIAGMRDKLIHNYFGVDIEQVWQTVQSDIPELKEKLNRD